MRRQLVALAALAAVAWFGLAVASGQTGDAAGQPLLAFVQLSDPQFGMFAANKDFAQETANLEFAVATINRLRPAFVVVSGDLVNRDGDPVQIDEYVRVMAKLDRAIPVYNVAGNHDVGSVPTSASLSAYVKRLGPDHYSFRRDGLVGVVLNSSLIQAPEKAPEEAAAQQRWLEAELSSARQSGARHIVVFMHHPLFVTDPGEADGYNNVPRERRARLLALFREAGVRYVFAGHYHRNATARDGNIEMVTSGPIGMPFGGAKSGLRVAVVDDADIRHRYYELGELPNRIAVAK